MLPSVKALLASIVDYAGLFPPAKLDLHLAMVNYTDYQLTPYSWLLNRFVLPVFRWNEFAAFLPTLDLKQRSLSLIISKDWETEIEIVRSLISNNNITVTALEFPPLPPTEIQRILPHLPAKVDVFFEIPLSGDFKTISNSVATQRCSCKNPNWRYNRRCFSQFYRTLSVYLVVC